MLRRLRDVILNVSGGNRLYAVFVLLACIGLVVYICSNVAKGFYSVTIETEQILLGTMVNASEKNVVIVRDEVPIYATSSGIPNFLYNEGEKARKGTTIVAIKGSDIAETNKYRLKIIESKIAEINSGQVSVQSTEEELARIDARLEYLYAEAQNRILSGEYSYIESVKEEIILINDEKLFIEENGAGATRSVEELEAEKTQILNNIQASNSTVVAPITGVVVPYADGYELELTLDNMKNLTVTDLEKYKDKSVVSSKNTVVRGDPIGKVVNNDKWYIVCEVDKDDIQSIATETKMNIYIENTKISAFLEDFHKGEDEKFIGFFRVQTDSFKFYEKRVFPARLEYKSSEGILVPKSAVTTNEGGRIGAYVLDEAGTARFKVIENIISEDSTHYICSNEKGSSRVSLYDEIVSNPKLVKEGQKVIN